MGPACGILSGPSSNALLLLSYTLPGFYPLHAMFPPSLLSPFFPESHRIDQPVAYCPACLPVPLLSSSLIFFPTSFLSCFNPHWLPHQVSWYFVKSPPSSISFTSSPPPYPLTLILQRNGGFSRLAKHCSYSPLSLPVLVSCSPLRLFSIFHPLPFSPLSLRPTQWIFSVV